MDNDKEDKPTTASQILIGNVYQISDDMLRGVYSSVESISRFETIFINMGKKLSSISKNMEEHLLNQKWLSGKSRRDCISKKKEVDALTETCNDYANICKDMVESMIKNTEKLERNAKLKGVMCNFVSEVESAFAEEVMEDGDGEDEDESGD